MSLYLLLAFVVAQYSPGTLKEVFKKYSQINHNLRSKYCCGFRLLRRKAEKVDEYKGLFPIVGLDTNDKHQVYVTWCDHLPCRNSNCEVDFSLANLCLEGKLDRTTLNLLRPVSYYDAQASEPDKQSTPNYVTNENGCR